MNIPTEILDDLCSRFIINIPIEQRDDLVRLFFAVELAHWYYLDFFCEEDQELRACPIKDFAVEIFQHCPFLRHKTTNLDEILSQWREFKFSVPTYGAILVDPSYEEILLVRGFYNRESWGFPKGKVQENEAPIKCAIREVMEEVGYDIKDRLSEDQSLQREVNGQIIRLYIVTDVPKETKFVPKTKNEIKETRWFPIADLPSSRRPPMSGQTKNKLNHKAFFMVIPFVQDLRRWINHRRGLPSSPNFESDPTNEVILRYDQTPYQKNNRQQQRRNRTSTYHGDTRSTLIAHDTTPTHSTFSLNNPLDEQLHVQHTIQRHFSQILKNDSITVTDQTKMTETLLRQTSQKLPIETNVEGNKRSPLTNLTNQETIHVGQPFCYDGPQCWKQFRLNRSTVFRCLGQ